MKSLGTGLTSLPLWVRLLLGVQAGVVAALLLWYPVLMDRTTQNSVPLQFVLTGGALLGAGFAYFDYRLGVRRQLPPSPRRYALATMFAVGCVASLAYALGFVERQASVVIAAGAVGLGVYALGRWQERARWLKRSRGRWLLAASNGFSRRWTQGVTSLIDAAASVTLHVPESTHVVVGELRSLGGDRWSGKVLQTGNGHAAHFMGHEVVFLEQHVQEATLRSAPYDSDV